MKTKSGFTLIELLITIAILAILATIGIVVFGPVSKNARDARRREDINSIAQAMENNFVQTTSRYQALTSSMFSNGIPTDPVNEGSLKYCYRETSDGSAPAISACTVGDPIVANDVPSGYPNTKWVVCANLENSTPNYYCRSNIQMTQ